MDKYPTDSDNLRLLANWLDRLQAEGYWPGVTSTEVQDDLRRMADKLEAFEWKPIDTAPQDGTPILAWCDHEADPYFIDKKGTMLTTYAAHAEGVGHAPDGLCIVEWGGEYSEGDEYGVKFTIPAWWFASGLDEAANPIWWMPLPEPPQK